MKGTITANGSSDIHVVKGPVHVHVDGTFGGGTAVLEYVNRYDSYKYVAAQDETSYDGTGTNGTFAGGTGYVATNTITLASGAVITVDVVAGGVVTEFTVTSSSTDDLYVGNADAQASTSGSGTGFSLTAGQANVERDWKAIAGESYTAASDAFLSIPANTKLRVTLSGATAPAMFYEVRS